MTSMLLGSLWFAFWIGSSVGVLFGMLIAAILRGE